MERKEEAVWNRLSPVYDLFMKKDEATYKGIIQRMTQLLNPEVHVLEIATGTGKIALGLSEHILNIEAIDFSPDMIAAAIVHLIPSLILKCIHRYTILVSYDLLYKCITTENACQNQLGGTKL